MSAKSRAATPPSRVSSEERTELANKSFFELVQMAKSLGGVDQSLRLCENKEAVITLIEDLRSHGAPIATPWNNGLLDCDCHEIMFGLFCPCFFDMNILRKTVPLEMMGMKFENWISAQLVLWVIPFLVACFFSHDMSDGQFDSSVQHVIGSFTSLIIVFTMQMQFIAGVKRAYNIDETGFMSAMKFIFCPCPFKMQMDQHVRTCVKVGPAVKVSKI